MTGSTELLLSDKPRWVLCSWWPLGSNQSIFQHKVTSTGFTLNLSSIKPCCILSLPLIHMSAFYEVLAITESFFPCRRLYLGPSAAQVVTRH